MSKMEILKNYGVPGSRHGGAGRITLKSRNLMIKRKQINHDSKPMAITPRRTSI